MASTLEQSRSEYDLDNFVTNQSLTTQLTELELRLDSKLMALNIKISDIKYDMVKWIAGMMLAQAGVVAALVKLL